MRGRGGRAPGRAPRSARPGAPSRFWPIALPLALAATGVALVVVAFGFHPIGDYFTETDFYGGYAAGARALLRGHMDWSRYGVYGPVYELALAAVGAMTGDLFAAARWISIASAMTILGTSAWLARHHGGAAAAFWLVLLVAANPAFFRYGYSASTDMLACGLWTLAAAALLASHRPLALVLAGAAAALATLTRYNLVSLVPAGLVLVLSTSAPLRDRTRAALLFLGAFVALAAPFTVASFVAGHPLGETLVRDSGFYLNEFPDRALELRYRTLGESVLPDTLVAPRRVASRILSGLPGHVAGDARTLLGWPATALVVLAVASLIAARRARPILALLPLWAFSVLALAPVFYSDRYSLMLVPLYLAPAALALAAAVEASRVRAAMAILATLVVLGLSLASSVTLQRSVAASIPTEALRAGAALRRVARPGEGVIARKPHVAYPAGLEPVPFPDVESLESLATFARRSRARYLFYSWYELRLRPRFGYLLDTSATIPGLEPIHATTDKPSATYRIGEGFGEPPTWWNDAAARGRIRSRVNALLGPGDAADEASRRDR